MHAFAVATQPEFSHSEMIPTGNSQCRLDLAGVENVNLGTYCWCDPQHADRDLGAYEWRFLLKTSSGCTCRCRNLPLRYRIISPALPEAKMPQSSGDATAQGASLSVSYVSQHV